MGLIEQSSKSRRRGSSLAGALALVVLATAGGARAGAGAGLAIRRMAPELPVAPHGDRLTLAALRGARISSQSREKSRVLAVHFPVARVAGAGKVADWGEAAPLRASIERLARRLDAPSYPSQPDLRIHSTAGNGGGYDVRTDVSYIYDGAAGGLVAALCRTVDTTAWDVATRPFWIDRQGAVHPITEAQYEAALAKHNTLLVGDGNTTLAEVVAALHVPAREIPRALWLPPGGSGRTEFASPSGERRALVTTAYPPEPKSRKVTIGSGEDPSAGVFLEEGTVLVRTKVVRPPGADSPYDVTLSDAVAALRLDPRGAGVRVVPLPSSAQGLIPVERAAIQQPVKRANAPRPRRNDKRTLGAPSGTAQPSAPSSR